MTGVPAGAALEVLDPLPTRSTECSLPISLPYWLSQVQYSLFFLIHQCKDMIATVIASPYQASLVYF
jgi:hypothetical protein